MVTICCGLETCIAQKDGDVDGALRLLARAAWPPHSLDLCPPCVVYNAGPHGRAISAAPDERKAVGLVEVENQRGHRWKTGHCPAAFDDTTKQSCRLRPSWSGYVEIAEGETGTFRGRIDAVLIHQKHRRQGGAKALVGALELEAAKNGRTLLVGILLWSGNFMSFHTFQAFC